MILVFCTFLIIFKLNFNFNLNLLMLKKILQSGLGSENFVHIVLNLRILWVSIFLVSIRKSECGIVQPRRGNSGGSWEPSSQKLSELAEIIG